MQFRSLPGLISYNAAKELQLELVEKRARDEIEDTVLFLEHEPVVTRGRGLQFTGTPRERSIPLLAPLPPGVAFAESERGGDLTYHGPGQLVVYPIFKLDGLGFSAKHDITDFLRKLEQVFIDELQSLGLEGSRKENATGVWVGEKKVASIGIAVRKWVTYHGIAVNVVNDLKPFHLISPCGYAPEVMTNLKELLAKDVMPSLQEWRPWLEKRLHARFEFLK